jgi:hypothetical protein
MRYARGEAILRVIVMRYAPQLIVSENEPILLANLFNTTKSGFLQRLLQSLGAFKQAIGEATFQRFRVRQQYPNLLRDMLLLFSLASYQGGRGFDTHGLPSRLINQSFSYAKLVSIRDKTGEGRDVLLLAITTDYSECFGAQKVLAFLSAILILSCQQLHTLHGSLQEPISEPHDG